MWKSVSTFEVDKFKRMQQHWWDPSGPLRTLHMLNPHRVSYINEMCLRHLSRPLGPTVKVLDVGCGGGVLSESLARLGANVTGVDACAESLEVANERMRMTQNISLAAKFVHCDVGSLDENEKFDAVVVSEVVEHVEDASPFLAACYRLVKPGGIAVVTTMDKTVSTLFSHIFVAEYVLGLVPPGTHDWAKFIPPGDIKRHARRHQLDEVSLQHVWALPDIPTSIATRSVHLKFALCPQAKSGHYFWTGKKQEKQ